MNEPTWTKWMLAAMFTAGLVSGLAIAAACGWRFSPSHGMPTGAEIVKRIQKDLKSNLKITEAQEAQIAPMLERHRVALDAIRNETAARILKAIEQKNADLANMLTPEQRERYEREENERLRHFRERHQP
jgi:Spy/CpxP family protein refolding chaperone